MSSLDALDPRVERILRCPSCGAVLASDASNLTCARGHRFARHDGFVDLFVPSEDVSVRRTIESFGYEWTTFDAIQPEDEGWWRWYFADVDLTSLDGAIALDAGCGKGRFTRFTAAHVDAIVAVDGSDAVHAAVRNLGDLGCATVVRADLLALPFEPSSFDFVCCLGVLHHLPDPEEGFRRLVRLLRPGGQVLIYVYSRTEGRGIRALGLRAATQLRRLTTRMPHRALRWLCAPLAALLYAAVVVPGGFGARFGIGVLAGLPLQTYRGRPVRGLWLDTFDRLSAPLENRYRPEEIRAWFEGAGLHVDALREDAGLFVLGRR